MLLMPHQTLDHPRLKEFLLAGSRNLAIAFAYLLLAAMSAREFPGVSPFWPPAALAAIVALRAGWGGAPGLFIGSLLGNILSSRLGVGPALVASIGNALAPMLGRMVLERLGGRVDSWWEHPRGALAFIASMGLGQSMLSAALGIAGIAFFGGLHVDPIGAFVAWSVADTCAVVTMTPLFQLVLMPRAHPLLARLRGTWPQVAGVFGVVLCLWTFAVCDPGLIGVQRGGVLALSMFPLIWSVFALDVTVTTGLLAMTFMLLVGSAVLGIPRELAAFEIETIVALQFLLVAVGGAILFAMALQQAHRKATQQIAEQSARLEILAREQTKTIVHQHTQFQTEFGRLSSLTTMLSTINQIITNAQDEAGLLQRFCELIVGLQGVALAWIGKPDAKGHFVVLAKAGTAVAHLHDWQGDIDASALLGQGPAVEVWRSERAVFVHDVQGDPAHALWSEALAKIGIHAAAGMPLFRGGTIWATFNLYLTFAEGFDAALQKVAAEIAADISTGLDRLDVIRREREQSLLNAALLSNVDVGVNVMRYPERTFEHVNARLLEMAGARSIEDLKARELSAFYGNLDDFTRVRALADQILQTGRGAVPDVSYRRLDGASIRVDVSGVRIDLGDGATRILWTQIDVTERSRQAMRLQRSQGVYRALAAAADSLLQSGSEAGMIARLCQSLVDGADFAAVWLTRPDDAGRFAPLAVVSDRGEGADALDAGRLALDDDGCAVARAWRAQEPVLRERHGEAPLEPCDAELLAQLDWDSVFALPVRRAGVTWAVLLFATRQSHFFDDTARMACEQVAALLGHGLDELDRKSALQMLQDAESRRARTDALTGLPNRFALDEYLPGALSRARRRGAVMAVGMLDLDDFKPVNDHFGHAVGDVLLQRLAQALRATMRDADFLARVGGDEFVVVFEGLEAEQCMVELKVALERLHTAVDAPFDLGEGRLARVGMTMGLARYPEDADEPDTLLRLADAAMYACKMRKADRIQWWRIGALGADAAEDDSGEDDFEMFGIKSTTLLQGLGRPLLNSVALAFAGAFYDAIRQHPELGRALHGLREDEFLALKRAQAEHLLHLLSPDTTREALLARASVLGRVHALVGVSGAGMEQAFALYEELLRAQLESTLISSQQRYRILRVATARLRLDVQTQLNAIDETTAQYFEILKKPAVHSTRWVDILPAALTSLSALPGIVHAIVFRPDARGRMLDELGAGHAVDAISAALRAGDLYPNLNPAPDMTPGPLSLAWFTRQVHVVDAYMLDPRLTRWHAIAQAAGWRSAATIPIGSAGNADSVLMLFGAYPHQFSSSWARSWLELVHSRITADFAATSAAYHAIAPDLLRTFRALLYSGGLRMWVQPIVDLRTGTVSRVEALARLQAPDGTVFNPGQFLPAFGEQELHALFRQALEQALACVQAWREQSLQVDIAVNLPPTTLNHPDCRMWIESALREAEVAPAHLTLEILESGELVDARSDEAIHAISALGVRLALDDLGSGYSSLTRLASLPIDIVKIDQGLIRELPRDPVKTVRLLATLLRIGEEFAPSTVVEGLEDDGFVEAARILGAKFAQGFALARPMPTDVFPEWRQRAVDALADTRELATWPGALAHAWVTLHGLAAQVPRDAGSFARFLQRHGVDDSTPLRWLETARAGDGSEACHNAADALLTWLAQRVRDAYDVSAASLRQPDDDPE